MKRFDLAEIEAGLAEIDRQLTQPLTIVVIGGAAVALLCEDAQLTTKDVDTWQLGQADAAALQAANRGTDLVIGASTIADLPHNFEDRLVRVLHSLVRLTVAVPEPHDLLLSKILRWHQGDEQHAQRLHAHFGLDDHVLIDRYNTEMTHVVGDARRHRENLADCIGALFGDLAMARARSALR